MEKREIEVSIASGYTLTVGTSENADLPEGRAFDSVTSFEAALIAAQNAVGAAPYTKVNFALRTHDGRISYAGCYALERAETPDVLAHVMASADESIALAPMLRDPEQRLSVKIRALTSKLVFALIGRAEADAAIALARAEMAVYSHRVTVKA